MNLHRSLKRLVKYFNIEIMFWVHPIYSLHKILKYFIKIRITTEYYYLDSKYIYKSHMIYDQ